MTQKRISRKIAKILAFIVGGLLVLLLAFHFWFINHAEELIENLVADQSNGKLKLKVQKFKFNWFSRRMELQNAVFYSTDTVNAAVAYRFEIPRIKIQVQAVLPMIFEKRIVIDSLRLVNPSISVTRINVARDSLYRKDTTLSLPQEMGRIYHSIQDALEVLKVDRFQIDNGKFALIDKSNPNDIPVRISRLNFHLDNLSVDTSNSRAENKIFFSDDVGLQTSNQDILFPDGRHRLSFANFRVNLQNRLAEFDSCTITATKGDSSHSSFKIFFDKLRMTNIDFDTLYHAELIKADSVYCINPRFALDVDLEKNDGPVRPPQLNELIQQLTGDMQLAFVVVQNGSFDIRTVREGRPSSFTSDHNNFEVQGLRIQKDAPRPLIVERFAMAIRNYENFLRDSTYGISFDSILLNNNRISLSNFSYKELRNGKTINSLVMPQFELYGLSWDYLIFNRLLKAERVSLYQPVINYDFSKSNDGNAKDVFGTLANIGKILQLNNFNIVDGEVNLLFKNKASLRLEHTNMFLLGEKLVASQRVSSIRQAVDILNFKKALFKMGDLSAEMSNAQFSGLNNKMKAERIRVDHKDVLGIEAAGVTMSSMLLDDRVQHIDIHGISWDQADIKLFKLPKADGNKGPSILLTDIKGANTKLSGSDSRKQFSVYLNKVLANSFSTESGKPLVDGLVADGRDLLFSDASKRLAIASLKIEDGRQSAVNGINYTRHVAEDSTLITVPAVSFIPDINSMLAGKIKTDQLLITQPYIHIYHRRDEEKTVLDRLPDIEIGSVSIQEPTIDIETGVGDRVSRIDWRGKENKNSIQLNNIRSDAASSTVTAEGLQFSIDHFHLLNARGRSFDAGNSKINAKASKIELQRTEAGSWDWEGRIDDLSAREFVMDSIGKHSGRLNIESARLQQLTISSSLLLNPRELVSRNKQFRLQEITGSFHDSKDQLNWYNAVYDRSTRSFTLDSFAYTPTSDRDTYIKNQPYQSDFLRLRTGRIAIGPFDLERYTRDTILDLGVVSIDRGWLSDYRDKRVARKPGMVTLLPAHMLQEIPVNLLIDTLRVNDAHVDYEEVNEKNDKVGKIAVYRLNGKITHLRNFNLTERDSLEVNASAYLEDKIQTKLHVRESYTDSLGGFLMTSQMGPADLRVLNPVLESLASINLKSGQLDTMSMRVAGREYQAYGEMKLYYHDLKVKVIRPGEKKSFLGGVMSFLANTIIQNKNANKTSKIFFRRLRDRSAINYLVKIALSGFASGIGVKKNKKLIRKNKAEIQQRPLPTIQD